MMIWFPVANEYRLSTMEEQKQKDRKASAEPGVYSKTYDMQWESVQGKKQEIRKMKKKKEEIQMQQRRKAGKKGDFKKMEEFSKP